LQRVHLRVSLGLGGDILQGRGIQRKCKVWPTVASVDLHPPPGSLAAGSRLQEGKRTSKSEW